MTVSPQRRREIIDARRRGTVPHSSLDAFAVGLERFEPVILIKQPALVVLRGRLFERQLDPSSCRRTRRTGSQTAVAA